ncbi:MAG: serine/threonine protein kinase, partial [Planctomycetales bacterium]|nr:serine/threonine protein kinase [Planctomycetales bacterium]
MAGVLDSQLAGRFELVGELGRGAFGTVYLARDLQLGRDVAMKIPREGVFRSPHDADRFVREAKAAAALQHPNICPVFDIVDHNGIPIIVMQYLQGRRLDQVLKQQRVSQRQAAAIVRSLARTLQAAHRQGIVHRDLKPANIMIDAVRREPVIMDFGLARVGAMEDSELTRTGQILGSPAYMSPEQADADFAAIGPRSDVYSLGVIMYELLCGERPFDGSVGEVLAALLHVDPPRPAQRRADVDPELEGICMKAMSKAPEQRHETMDELARELGFWLKSGGAEGRSEAFAREQSGSHDGHPRSLDEAGNVQVPNIPERLS